MDNAHSKIFRVHLYRFLTHITLINMMPEKEPKLARRGRSCNQAAHTIAE
jgi:hypothetical protein